MSKTQQILEYMKQNGSITSWIAIQKFGATRLSAIIFNLKKRGHVIDSVQTQSVDRNGNNSRYAVYIYKGVE